MSCRTIPGGTVPGEGFEPPKALPADLQSAPFGRSGIPARPETIRGAEILTHRREPYKEDTTQLGFSSGFGNRNKTPFTETRIPSKATTAPSGK